jgi:hypothetical protein
MVFDSSPVDDAAFCQHITLREVGFGQAILACLWNESASWGDDSVPGVVEFLRSPATDLAVDDHVRRR